jgi:hypothetical protein
MMRSQVGRAALCATPVRDHLAAAHPHHNHLQHAHHSRSYQVVACLHVLMFTEIYKFLLFISSKKSKLFATVTSGIDLSVRIVHGPNIYKDTKP